MDPNRVEGAAKKNMGRMKEAAGKALGDEKLRQEGKAQKTEGTVQNAVGGIKDTLRGK